MLFFSLKAVDWNIHFARERIPQKLSIFALEGLGKKVPAQMFFVFFETLKRASYDCYFLSNLFFDFSVLFLFVSFISDFIFTIINNIVFIRFLKVYRFSRFSGLFVQHKSDFSISSEIFNSQRFLHEKTKKLSKTEIKIFCRCKKSYNFFVVEVDKNGKFVV